MWRFFLLGPSHSSGPTAVCLVFSPWMSISDSPASRLPSSSPASRGRKKTYQHRWVIKWVALIIIIPYIIPLWTILHFQKTNYYYKWQNQVVVTSENPQSQRATMYFCIYIYIALCTYIFCKLTSCMLLWKRSSHECLQEQKEAPWNRKESNVWERGCYLLTFDLLWSELECVFECRTDLQSQVHTHHAMGYLGISLQEVRPC